MYNKILGSLLGAAAGDAMGAATETRTRKQIEEKFGGYVTDFLTPPQDTFARGSRAGQITDDFSVAYMTLREILKTGKADYETAVSGLFKMGGHTGIF
ncbi:MAG: ADP-ribosylglycohydrolase family protein [Enterocloster sp.]